MGVPSESPQPAGAGGEERARPEAGPEPPAHGGGEW